VNAPAFEQSINVGGEKTKTTYFSDSVSSNAQKVSDMIPMTSPGNGGPWPVA